MKLRCLLVDDEPPALDVLRHYIAEVPFMEVVGECHHAFDAFQFLNTHAVDLIFLDVNLPKLKGTDFYKSLNHAPKVIFTSAHRDFAVEGFDLGATDFLLKPYSVDRFLKAVERASNQGIKYENDNKHTSSERALYVKSDRKMVKVPVREILFVESQKDYVKIVAAHKQIITKQTIASIESMLPENEFVRVHRSFIVAMNKVDSYNQHTLMVGSEEIPIGPLFRQQAIQRLESQR